MLTYPEIDPVAIRVGPLAVHWYGLMYLIGFLGFWVLARIRAAREGSGWQKRDVDDLLFFGVLGVVLGGRLGYVLFYDLSGVLENPLSVFAVWRGGMSFHGGLIGVLVALYLYSRSRQRRFFDVTDFVAPMIPLGLGAGRIGNFINGELWGRVSDVPWAMIFPGAGPLPRHPSQLYEAFLEGLVLFIVLWIYSSQPRPRMAVSGLFLFGYGLFRFAVEFFREPDRHIGFVALDWLTMGQILSAPMILAGMILLVLAYQRDSQGASA